MRRILHVFLLLVFFAHTVSAQEREIRGNVKSKQDGLPLPGVSVRVKGTKTAAQTAADGSFTISTTRPKPILIFSYLGFKTTEHSISSSNITIALEEDANQLNDVVITAGGIARQSRSLGYSTAKISGDDLNQVKVTNIANGLTGKVAGLQVNTINNGVDPGLRIILRGNRSLTGNNEALVVLDGVPVPSTVLATLNPEDIDNISVLKGANSAALYGSTASNGALIISTKRGSKTPKITFTNSSQFENISFLPKFQDQFGSGSTNYTATYDPIENQQYGPAYDGKLVNLGEELEDGSIQQVTYESRLGEKKKFFNTGSNIQNSASVSTGNETSNFYFSAQNSLIKGIIPKDKADRTTVRFNASKDLGKFTIGANTAYTQNRKDYTTAGIYWNIFNTSSFIPITDYKDWRNNKFANPNGYYNGYYGNPYFLIDNQRANARTDNFLGDVKLGLKATSWLSIDYRLGLNTRNFSSKSYTDKFTYTPYTLANTEGAKGNTAGSVRDSTNYVTRLNSDLFVNIHKDFNKVTNRLILGHNLQQSNSKFTSIGASQLNVPGVFNVNNRVGELSGSESNFKARSYSLFYDYTIGYNNYFFVHTTGRNDWTSILNSENWSYFYPSVDASLVLTDALPELSGKVLNFAKIRAGYSKVGQVNLGLASDRFGAYSLDPTFSTAVGFPYGALTGLTVGNSLVDRNLKPEFTKSFEIGAELGLFTNLISIDASYYDQKTTNQTFLSSISNSTGYSTYLLNAGELSNKGFEADIKFSPFRNKTGVTWDFSFNYNYNDNKVVSLNGDATELSLSPSGGSSYAQVYAIKGQSYPTIKGTAYLRDSDGRIILNAAGLPSKDPSLKEFGNTNPKHKFGFVSNVRYKGFDLGVVLDARTGYYVYNTIGENLDFTGSGERSTAYGRQPFLMPNSSVSDGNGNYVANTSVLTPGGAEFWANTAYNRGIAENYVTKGNFLKVREISLSYTLPANLLAPLKYVKGATIGVFGRNLFTWVPKDNIYTDPEYSYTSGNAVGINTYDQAPPTRFVGGTISINF